MVSDEQRIVVGLTGAFGSGCTTAARHLRDGRGFKLITLSDTLRVEWRTRGNTTEPTRADLQKLGDELRMKEGGGVLVNRALNEFRAGIEGKDGGDKIVIDGIRNLQEISRLQDVFGYRFVLVAVLASIEDRWSRIGSTAYIDRGLSFPDFIADNLRDMSEDSAYGQQVQLCLDKADILIDNSPITTLVAYQRKVLDFVDLATGQVARPAMDREILMNIAFSAAHSSKCLKRHVGAVVADPSGKVVGVGYNENPIGTKPCMEEPAYNNACYRDIVRNNHFRGLFEKGTRCPKCAEPLPQLVGPPWLCPKCTPKTNLEAFFFPDRAMNWCTAIHAELWAILAAGERCKDGTVYTTTFPCFQCAEKIIQVGLKQVVFTEPYPDPYSKDRLILAKIELRQFEGVRSSSFERIFSKLKPD